MTAGKVLKISSHIPVIKNTLVYQFSRVLFGNANICFHLSAAVAMDEETAPAQVCDATEVARWINARLIKTPNYKLNNKKHGFRN
jgi:hypothetical protein